MALYNAMKELLVLEGPLENLFSSRLPPEQTAAVDVAHIRQGGGAGQRYLGSTPVMDGPAGVMHDGGVLWNETTVPVPGAKRIPRGGHGGCRLGSRRAGPVRRD